MTLQREIAPAKINLALHVRRRRDDGRHDIETIFAFCTDGDLLEGESFEPENRGMTLALEGPFGGGFDGAEENMVERAWAALTSASGISRQTHIRLDKRLPIASGLGGGSADAAAALRLLTSLWGIDPAHAQAVAPRLGSDVPACLLSMTARGSGAGDELELVDTGVAGTPLLLVNPRIPLSTRDVFEAWDGVDRGPLDDWREGRNDLETPAIARVPEIAELLDWLRARDGAWFARMSGSGATCFAMFADEPCRDAAAAAVPDRWWHLATFLR